MRFVLFVLALFMLFPSFAYAADEDAKFIFPEDKDYPVIPKFGKQVTDFVSRQWKIVGRATGDLNGDKAQDSVLFVKGNLPKFKQKNDGFGVEVFDTNPRMLLILFADSKRQGYKLAEQSSTFIPIPEWPTMEEPFERLSIKNGVLKIDVTLWYNAGSWSRSDTSYLFRYERGKFVLIGADRRDMQRNSGEQETLSYNFLTGKAKITTGSYDTESKIRARTRWRNIPSRKLRTLDSFVALYEWQVLPDHYL